MKSTPSERIHLKLDPFSTFGSDHVQRHPLLVFLKNIVGTGIPLLLILYLISSIIHVSVTMILGYLIASLTFIYILLDHFEKKQEISLFYIGGDIWLFILLIVGALGLLVNASGVSFGEHFLELHWILLLYTFTYAFYLFPGIKRFFHIITIFGLIVSIYGIIQHFFGVDLLYQAGLTSQSATYLGPPSRVNNYLNTPNEGYYQVIGFFQNHIDYGMFFSMALCFPVAGVLLLKDISLVYRIFLIITSASIGLSLLWTYDKGVWSSSIISLLFMSGFINRRVFVKMTLILSLIFGMFYYFDNNFQNKNVVFDKHYHNQETKMDVWKANLAMFLDHPWVGIGLKQDEVHIRQYYQKLNIDNWEVDSANNAYIYWLATTGSLGFISYMLFILAFLLMTGRIWIEVSLSNTWHRVFILALLGVQIAMHVGGLAYWNMQSTQYFFVFSLAMISYIYKKYNEASVFDDYCL